MYKKHANDTLIPADVQAVTRNISSGYCIVHAYDSHARVAHKQYFSSYDSSIHIEFSHSQYSLSYE